MYDSLYEVKRYKSAIKGALVESTAVRIPERAKVKIGQIFKNLMAKINEKKIESVERKIQGVSDAILANKETVNQFYKDVAEKTNQGLIDPPSMYDDHSIAKEKLTIEDFRAVRNTLDYIPRLEEKLFKLLKKHATLMNPPYKEARGLAAWWKKRQERELEEKLEAEGIEDPNKGNEQAETGSPTVEQAEVKPNENVDYDRLTVVELKDRAIKGDEASIELLKAKTDKDNAERRVRELEGDNNLKKDQISKLTEEIDKKDKRVIELEGLNKQLEADKKDQNDKISDLEKKFTELNSKFEELMKQLESVQKGKEAAEARANDIVKNVGSAVEEAVKKALAEAVNNLTAAPVQPTVAPEIQVTQNVEKPASLGESTLGEGGRQM